MRILLIGERYSQNLGDAVICKTVESIIKEYDNTVVIDMFDLSGRISYNERYAIFNNFLNVKKCIKVMLLNADILLYNMRNKEVLARYLKTLVMLEDYLSKNQYDKVVFAGGALFQNYFAEILYAIIRRFKNMNVRIIFHAIGMGTLDKHSVKILQKMLYSKDIYSISLRDSYIKFFEIFHVNCILEETYDTALNCCCFYEGNDTERKGIGIGGIQDEKYRETLSEIITYFLEKELEWKVFTNGEPSDEEMVVKILRSKGLENKIDEILIPRPKNEIELINLITRFEKIISFRMHGIVVATAYGIPTYGIEWEPKVKEFMEKCNRNEYVYSLNDKMDLDVIFKDEFCVVDMKQVEQCAKLSKECLLLRIFK